MHVWIFERTKSRTGCKDTIEIWLGVPRGRHSSWVHPGPQEFNLSLLTTKHHFPLFHLSFFPSQELLKLTEKGALTVANYPGWNIFDISPNRRVSHFFWRPHRERLISGHERQRCWQSDRTAGHASSRQWWTRQSSEQGHCPCITTKVSTWQGVEAKTTAAVITPDISLFQHLIVLIMVYSLYLSLLESSRSQQPSKNLYFRSESVQHRPIYPLFIIICQPGSLAEYCPYHRSQVLNSCSVGKNCFYKPL